MKNSFSVRRRERRGFTLIEVLLVLVILVVLASISTLSIMKVRKSSGINSAKVQIGSLEQMLDIYALDMNGFPSTQQGLVALREVPADVSDPSKWNGPYAQKEVPADPWGNPYQYELSGAEQYRIWSWGPDRVDGTEDDVSYERK